MKTIQQYTEKAGFSPTPLQLEQFQTYRDMLLEWNQKINLTAITDPDEIALKHFTDSLTVVPFIENAFKNQKSRFPDLSLIDIGTGAGFPGIPLKIMYPELSLTLMDSLQKRIDFLSAVTNALSFSNSFTVHSRAEDGARSEQHREKYDVAIARAVASMPVLSEYCLPYVKVGGVFIAMKANVRDELESAKYAISVLGGEIEDCSEFTLPGSDMKRSIVVIRKKQKTPKPYPRKAGKPEKEPLMRK